MAVSLVTEAGELLIKDGDKKYRATAGGFETVVEHGFASETITGKEATRLANQALILIEDGAGKHSAETLKSLHSTIEHYGAMGAEAGRVQRIKDALHAAAELEHAESVEAIESILKKNPLAAKFMGEGAKTNLDGFKFKISEFEAKAATAAAKVEKVAKLNTELEKLMTAEKPSAEAVSKFITTNMEHLNELEPSAEAIANLKRATKFDFAAAKSGILKDAADLVTKVKPKLERVVELKDAIAAKPDAKELKTLTDELTKLEKEVGEVAGHKYGALIKAQLPEKLMTELKTVHPTMSAKFGVSGSAAGKEAGEKGWLGKLFDFNHGEEKLGQIAEKEGKAVSELGFFSKLNKTKAGIAAAGVVILGSVVASIGNKGPGEHAERSQSQGQQSAMGVA